MDSDQPKTLGEGSVHPLKPSLIKTGHPAE